MSYWIDHRYYTESFHGITIGEDFEVLLDRCQDVLNTLTHYQFSQLSKPNEVLKKALAYQVEHLYLKGGVKAVSGIQEGDVKSESMGQYSVTYNEKTQCEINGIPVSGMAYNLLLMQGYLYAGSKVSS